MPETQTQPASLLLDLAGVAALTGLSRRVIYRLMKAGDFPKPKAIASGPHARRWTRASIVRWTERLADAEVGNG